MTRRRNARSLDELTDAYNAVDRRSIFDKGDILLEAKAGHRKQFLHWLDSNLDISVDTAEREMKVAKLGSRFRKLRNLKLGTTTFYELADYEPEEELPAIIKELAKHATKKWLRPRDAERVIDVGIGRRRFGDYPDATLVQLANLYPADGPYYDKAVAALKEQAPDTDEAARAIVDKIDHERRAAAMDAIAESRRESRGHSLDGPPPIVPPPAMQGEPQRLSNGSDWAEAKELASAVACLRRLQSKPIARLVGRVAPDELRKVAGFLNEIADKQTEKCEP